MQIHESCPCPGVLKLVKAEKGAFLVEAPTTRVGTETLSPQPGSFYYSSGRPGLLLGIRHWTVEPAPLTLPSRRRRLGMGQVACPGVPLPAAGLTAAPCGDPGRLRPPTSQRGDSSPPIREETLLDTEQD